MLTDSGYPKCGMLMDPSHKDFDHYTVMWAEWLESIRKDVECVFGILKQRFRWLRNKVNVSWQSRIVFLIRSLTSNRFPIMTSC